MNSLKYYLFLASLSVQQTRGIISEVAVENTHDSPEKCYKNSIGGDPKKLLQKDLWNVSFDTFISSFVLKILHVNMPPLKNL